MYYFYSNKKRLLETKLNSNINYFYLLYFMERHNRINLQGQYFLD